MGMNFGLKGGDVQPRFKCGHCGRDLHVINLIGGNDTFKKTAPAKLCSYCDVGEPPARPVARAEE